MSGWQAFAFGRESLELAVGLGPEGLKNRGSALAIGIFPQANRIRLCLLAFSRDIYAVDPRTIETENLSLELRGELRIAVRVEELGSNFEAPERLNLILRRPYQIESVPQRTLSCPTCTSSLPKRWAAIVGSRITNRQVLPSSA